MTSDSDANELQSILGRDDDPDSPPEAEPTSETQEAPQDIPQDEPSHTSPYGLSEEELKQVQEKAGYWDMIHQDPRLVELMQDYIRKQSLGEPAPETQHASSESDNPSEGYVSKDIAKLREDMDSLRNMNRQLFANLQVERFARTHPDFEDYRKDMAELVQKHPSYSLDEAYELVKRTKTVQTPSRPEAPRQSAEVSPTRGVPPDQQDRRESVLKAKSFDAAFDQALLAAMEDQQNR